MTATPDCGDEHVFSEGAVFCRCGQRGKWVRGTPFPKWVDTATHPWASKQPEESDRDYTNRTGMTPGFPSALDMLAARLRAQRQADWKAIATALATVLMDREWSDDDCFTNGEAVHAPTCAWRVAMAAYQTALKAEGS